MLDLIAQMGKDEVTGSKAKLIVHVECACQPQCAYSDAVSKSNTPNKGPE